MEVKDVTKFQIQFPKSNVLTACVVAMSLYGSSWCAWSAEPELVPASPVSSTPASAASTPSNSGANPVANLNREELLASPGSFERRLKLNRQPADDTGFVPAPQPSMSLRDVMRMRDQMEEKKNWMFMDAGSLTEKRKYDKEEEFWKDRYDKKEDMRKKGWWEYKKDTSAVGLIMGKKAPKDGLERKELEAEFQAKIFGKGEERDAENREDSSKNDRSDRSRTGSLLFGGSGRDARESGHLNSDLDVKSVFTSELLPEKDVKGAFGLKELLGTDARSMDERAASAGRREDFRNFLNTSRMPAPAQSRTIEPPALNPASLQPPTFEVNGSKVTPSEFFSASTAASAQKFGSPGFSFDTPAVSRSPLNSAPAPTFRVSPAAAPSYITPEMMKAPKRRF